MFATRDCPVALPTRGKLSSRTALGADGPRALQNIFEGCSTDVSNARWSEDFANASCEPLPMRQLGYNMAPAGRDASWWRRYGRCRLDHAVWCSAAEEARLQRGQRQRGVPNAARTLALVLRHERRSWCHASGAAGALRLKAPAGVRAGRTPAGGAGGEGPGNCRAPVLAREQQRQGFGRGHLSGLRGVGAVRSGGIAQWDGLD